MTCLSCKDIMFSKYANLGCVCVAAVSFHLVSVRSCMTALYRLTNDSSHTPRWCSLVVLTICWVVYTMVIRVRSKSSYSRGPLWFERPSMSCNMSVWFLGMISSQMTFKFLVLWRDANSASRTENSPLSSNWTPARRIWGAKSRWRRERKSVSVLTGILSVVFFKKWLWFHLK